MKVLQQINWNTDFRAARLKIMNHMHTTFPINDTSETSETRNCLQAVNEQPQRVGPAPAASCHISLSGSEKFLRLMPETPLQPSLVQGGPGLGGVKLLQGPSTQLGVIVGFLSRMRRTKRSPQSAPCRHHLRHSNSQ